MPDTADVIEPSGSGRRLGMRGKVAVVAVAVAVVAAVGWVVFGTSDEHRAPSSIAASAVPTQAQPELSCCTHLRHCGVPRSQTTHR